MKGGRRGDSCFGRSLEDGVYEGEDEEEEVGDQLAADEGDRVPRAPAPAEEEIKEVECEGALLLALPHAGCSPSEKWEGVWTEEKWPRLESVLDF